MTSDQNKSSGATERPWRVFKTKNGLRLVGIGDAEGGGICDAGFGVWLWDHPEGIANAELIVTAVNAHGQLIKALEEAREYFDQRADISSKNENAPNDEMRLLVEIDAALTAAKVKS